MLTQSNYLYGKEVLELIKYNIAYNKAPLFEVVKSGLASRLLNHAYKDMLTEEQISILQQIAN